MPKIVYTTKSETLIPGLRVIRTALIYSQNLDQDFKLSGMLMIQTQLSL